MFAIYHPNRQPRGLTSTYKMHPTLEYGGPFDESTIFEIVCSFAAIALTDPRCLAREHRKDVPCHDAGLKAYDIPIITHLVKKLHRDG